MASAGGEGENLRRGLIRVHRPACRAGVDRGDGIGRAALANSPSPGAAAGWPRPPLDPARTVRSGM